MRGAILMSTYLWDPFAVLERLDREFDGIVRSSFGHWGQPRALRAIAPSARPVRQAPNGQGQGQGAEVATRPGRFGAVVPSADIATDGDDVVISLEVPGVDVEKDVVVEIDRGRLVVRGERGGSSETNEVGRVRRERWHGSFRREFPLPESVEAGKMSASYDRGVLSVRLPGAAAKPASTRIPVTAAAQAAEVPVAAAQQPASATPTAEAAAPTAGGAEDAA